MFLFMRLKAIFQVSSVLCASYWQTQSDSTSVEHQIYAALMDVCFIDAVNLLTND